MNDARLFKIGLLTSKGSWTGWRWWISTARGFNTWDPWFFALFVGLKRSCGCNFGFFVDRPFFIIPFWRYNSIVPLFWVYVYCLKSRTAVYIYSLSDFFYICYIPGNTEEWILFALNNITNYSKFFEKV